MRGRGKVLDWFKQAGRDIGAFLKRTKILSKGGEFVRNLNILPPKWNAGLGFATNLAKTQGYGVRLAGSGRKMNFARSVHSSVRKNKMLSRGLEAAMNSGMVPAAHMGKLKTAHNVALSMGYGRRPPYRGDPVGRRLDEAITHRKKLAGGALRLAGSRQY